MIVVSIASADRAQRIAEQHRHLRLAGDSVRHGAVIIGQHSFTVPGVERIAHLPHTPLNLSQARNVAGDWAAACEDEVASSENSGGVIVFLDADCLPAATLLEAYRTALENFPDSVASGPVTYLEPNVSTEPQSLPALRKPHPARPDIAGSEVRTATREEYNLFWTLNFAVTSTLWKRIRASFGGFDETFVGYGGEDTDFAWRLRQREIPFRWVGGADAFHVWHPVSSPPWEHLDEILTNARRFHDKWDEWPMQGWLEKFAEQGAIRKSSDGWEMVK